ncbi:hypothetical protein ONV78_30475 [Hahella sp. CR1]|uniref:hypothetical protein n=1 Tax=Hahella sp. CR1 TaxID=2992807 RepID=UPI002441FD4D|nr:hypothetical protein [Hahella sp. CR1]MDG9672098.1 hypothetical protein [Hahella sp. CR1]
MITNLDSAPLIKQFVGWAINFENQSDSLEVGDFLQTNEERIPDTIYGGFLVLPPVSIDEEFPVGNRVIGAYFWAPRPASLLQQKLKDHFI